MVCHCSLLANDPSVQPEKKCTSLGKRRPCAKLREIHPPSLCAQVLMLAATRRGSFPSLKVVCQPTSGRKEDAILDLTWAVGRASLVGSRIESRQTPEDVGFSREHHLRPRVVVRWCAAFFGSG